MKRTTLSLLLIIFNIIFLIVLLSACQQNDEVDETILPVESNVIPTGETVLPTLSIETTNSIPITSYEDYITSLISINHEDVSFQLTHVPAGIRLRGNSTQQYDKKPFRIKFDEDIQLLDLGQGPSKSWLLLGEYADYSMLRNKSTFDLAKGLLRHTFVSDTAFVEVILNGILQGVYLVAEQTHVNEFRVALDESGVLDSLIVDTGYLLELEGDLGRRESEGAFMVEWFDVPGYSGNPDEIGWWNFEEYTRSKEAAFYVIKSDAKSTEQIEYIQEHMIDIYDAIYVTQTQNSIANLINLESAVDMFLLQLITNDYDNNFSSTFVYKDKGGKFLFGPPWDFDLSYGNHILNQDTDTIHMYHLLYDLSQFEWFEAMTKSRWSEITTENGIFTKMVNNIELYTQVYEPYFVANHNQWESTRQTTGWHVYYQQDLHSQSDGAQHFRNWLLERKSFIDNYFGL